MNILRKSALALLLALTATAASAATADSTPTLKIGSPAPKLQNSKYVQGDPVKQFEPGKAYIVEFWATWCGPCRASIPHLNDIANKYKDKGLIVIGQDCFEEDESKVGPFVKDMGDKMTYRVALDDKTKDEKGSMAKNWMEAAGQSGIPTAFLVTTNGFIAWIGHPLELEEKQDVIDQVLAGKYDLKKAAEDFDKRAKDEADSEKAMAPVQEKLAAMNKAAQARKWDEALADLDAAEKLLPAKNTVTAGQPPDKEADHMKINFGVTRFRLLLAKKDYPAGYKLAEKLADDHKDDADLQNFIAMQLIGDKSIEKPNLDLASKLINRAVETSQSKDPEILDTQARILFMQGKKDAAIASETKALAVAEPADKPAVQKSLDSYKKGELPED